MEKISCYYCLGGTADKLKGPVMCSTYERLISREEAFLMPDICPAYFLTLDLQDKLTEIRNKKIRYARKD